MINRGPSRQDFRPVGSQAYQINFRTSTFRIGGGGAAGAGWPVMEEGSASGQQKLFDRDTLLLGVYFSCTISDTQAVLNATTSAAIAPSGLGTLSVLGDNNIYLQITYRTLQVLAAGAQFQRSIGSMFNPPFLPLIPGGSGLSIYASGAAASLSTWNVATIYWLGLEDYRAAQDRLIFE